MPKVLFSTNCYKKDHKYLVQGGFEYKYLLCDYHFDEKIIITNKVKGFGKENNIDRNIYSEKTLFHFELPTDCFVDKKTGIDGYIYSIDSLIELFLAKDFDYICHFCGDVELYKKADWITEGIKKIEGGCFGARPKLPRYDLQAESEQKLTETDIFSDHVYLISVRKILEDLPKIFSLTQPTCTDIHPSYGGESFERKMTRYLQATYQKLAIIQNAEEIPIKL